MVLDAEQIARIEESFSSIYENATNAKALRQANSDMIKALAESLQVEPSEIRDAYKYYVKKTEGKKGDVGTVNYIVDALEQK